MEKVRQACEENQLKFLKDNKIPMGDQDEDEADRDGYLVGGDSRRQMPFTILAAQRK